MGIVVGVIAVLLLAAITFLVVRGCRRGSGAGAATKPSGGFGAGGFGVAGRSNGKFQRFDDGLEMSDSRPGTRL